jgi:Uma2 family endonuclease
MENKNNEQEKENEVSEQHPILGYVSPDEYLEMERVSPQKHEYINGRIVSRAGATKNHAEIISKLFGEVYNYLEDKPCRAYPAGLKVVTIGRESYTYPDMIIFCGDPILEDFLRDTVVSPGVIIDIVSRPFSDIFYSEQPDLEEKFKLYQKIPSLREYIVINSRSRFVRVYRQQANRLWDKDDLNGTDCTLAIQTIGFKIPFDTLYENTPL